jgi:hypothetical protein
MNATVLWFGRRKGRSLAAVTLAAIGIYVVVTNVASPPPAIAGNPERDPQTGWVACNANARNGKPSTFRPLTDQAAAALVTPEPETRPDNAKPYVVGGRNYPATNEYVPSTRQVAAFRNARDSGGQTMVQFNPYLRFVDGRDGMRHPSTDDLIQWAAHKWGIPEDWLRAQYVRESYWNSFQLGDSTPVSRQAYAEYPVQARIAGTSNVYQSMGISQVRWNPDGTVGSGTEPLRWESTAFNVDYQAATVRFYYDNPSGSRTAWNDSSYVPCQRWNSIGGWFAPYPWNTDPGQARYAASVRAILKQRVWAGGGFQHWRPSSLPPGLRLR